MGVMLWAIWSLLLFQRSYPTMLVNSDSSIQLPCAENEREALLQFKHSFQIDCSVNRSPYAYPKVNSWITEANKSCCLWDGVDCDEESHVTGLDLSGSCLHGTFPQNSSLFKLNHLIHLNLADNHFNFSQIPSGIGIFCKLQSLDLSHSAFSGQIPSDLSYLSELFLLDLSDNGAATANNQLRLKLFDPSIEMLVQNLTHLRQLYLGKVDTSSNFPVILTNVTSLEELFLPLCDLYGNLPSDIFHLPHLSILDLEGNNNLAGNLPNFRWYNPLKTLSLGSTEFLGRLPPSIGELSHLEVLDITECQFTGFIPSSLGNLTTLTVLLLSGNNFQGDIPISVTSLTNLNILGFSDLNVVPGNLLAQLPRLHKLTSLSLAGLSLGSQIHKFLANFTELRILDLGSTQLKGPLPQGIANLTKLYQLFLENNELTGSIPKWISQLTDLKLILLSGNSLFGKMEIFFSLKNLRILGLSGTNITFPPSYMTNSSIKLGAADLSLCNLMEFPHFLQHQNEIELLLLTSNNIRGTIPQWFVDITKASLLFLDLSDNHLTGFEQPVTVLQWYQLEQFDISNNWLQGQLPIPPNSMEIYKMSFNLFTGVIPKQICNAKSLISLDLSSNKISGHIPYCMGYQLSNSLQLLDLRSNNLNGNIPPFTKSCKLKMINLSQNHLEGELPRSLANCETLEVLDIGRNHINDTFPMWLGSLLKLQVLVLSHNSFHGNIADPKSDHEFCFLRIIDLSNNFYTGPFPSRYLENWNMMKILKENQSDFSNVTIVYYFELNREIFSLDQKIQYSITITNKGSERLYPKILKVLRVLDFSSNNFTGSIPYSIGNLKGLQALNLSNNSLEGIIPASLANIADLESLDLSLNMLSGPIPTALAQLKSLEVFNVSGNQLVGPIPEGNQFDTFENSSFKGNLGLCGRLLQKKCGNTYIAPQPQPVRSNEDNEFIDWIIRSLGFLCGCIVGYVIGKLYITDKHHKWFMDTFGRQAA